MEVTSTGIHLCYLEGEWVGKAHVKLYSIPLSLPPPPHNYYPHWQATKPPPTTKGLAATFESLPFKETHTQTQVYTAPPIVYYTPTHH